MNPNYLLLSIAILVSADMIITMSYYRSREEINNFRAFMYGINQTFKDSFPVITGDISKLKSSLEEEKFYRRNNEFGKCENSKRISSLEKRIDILFERANYKKRQGKK